MQQSSPMYWNMFRSCFDVVFFVKGTWFENIFPPRGRPKNLPKWIWSLWNSTSELRTHKYLRMSRIFKSNPMGLVPGPRKRLKTINKCLRNKNNELEITSTCDWYPLPSGSKKRKIPPYEIHGPPVIKRRWLVQISPPPPASHVPWTPCGLGGKIAK